MTKERIAQLRRFVNQCWPLGWGNEKAALREAIDAIESLQAERDALVNCLSKVKRLAAFPTVDADDNNCEICGDVFDLRDGMESTGICDVCAQTELHDVVIAFRNSDAAMSSTP
jgi:hypothetical protein